MAIKSHEIDARGLKCPLPVLKLEKLIETVGVGETILVRATDEMAKIDIPLYCRKNGHDCVVETAEKEILVSVTKR